MRYSTSLLNYCFRDTFVHVTCLSEPSARASAFVYIGTNGTNGSRLIQLVAPGVNTFHLCILNLLLHLADFIADSVFFSWFVSQSSFVLKKEKRRGRIIYKFLYLHLIIPNQSPHLLVVWLLEFPFSLGCCKFALWGRGEGLLC